MWIMTFALIIAFSLGIFVGWRIGFRFPGPRMLAFISLVREALTEDILDKLDEAVKNSPKMSLITKKILMRDLKEMKRKC